MELRKIIKLINKESFFLVLISIIFVLTTFTFFLLKPNTYELEMTMDLGSEGTQNTNDFKYDNFYRYETSRKIVASTVEWLKDDGLTKSILNKADVKEENSLKIDANQISDVSFRVNWKNKEKKDLEAIALELEPVLQEKIEGIHEDSDFKFIYNSSGYIIKDGDLSTWLAVLIAGLVGLWLAFLWVLVKDYYLNNRTQIKRI